MAPGRCNESTAETASAGSYHLKFSLSVALEDFWARHLAIAPNDWLIMGGTIYVCVNSFLYVYIYSFLHIYTYTYIAFKAVILKQYVKTVFMKQEVNISALCSLLGHSHGSQLPH